MSAAEFARFEVLAETQVAIGKAIADTYDECASVVRAWLANPENSPYDLAALFAQRARIERTTKR